MCALYAIYDRLSVLVCLYSCVRLCVYGVRMLLHLPAGIGNFSSPTKHRSDNEDSEYLPSAGSDSSDSTCLLVYALIYILIMHSHISSYVCTLMCVSNSYVRACA